MKTRNYQRAIGIGSVKDYTRNLSKRAKEVLGFIPQTFDQAINSVISTRLLAVSQLCTKLCGLPRSFPISL